MAEVRISNIAGRFNSRRAITAVRMVSVHVRYSADLSVLVSSSCEPQAVITASSIRVTQAEPPPSLRMVARRSIGAPCMAFSNRPVSPSMSFERCCSAPACPQCPQGPPCANHLRLGQLRCRFLGCRRDGGAAGSGRRPRSAQARNRVSWSCGGSAGSMGIEPRSVDRRWRGP
jgi:hypothetical protein